MFKSQSAASAQAESSDATPRQFPSSDAVAKIRELHRQFEHLKTELADAERAVTLTIKNRELIELAGEKPEEVIRVKKAARDLVKRNLVNAQNELMRAFIDEGKRRSANHAEVWADAYREIVKPRAEKLALAQELLERAASEIIGLLRSDSVDMRQLSTIDDQTNSWNSLCRELAAPGNALLNVTPARKTIFASFLQAVKFRSFEVALTGLRDVLAPRPAPTRLTEESLAAERERSAEESHRLRTAQEVAQASENAKLAELAKQTKF